MRCFVERFLFGRLMVPEIGAFFWQKDDLEYHFPREVQAIRYTERTAVDRRLSAVRLFRGSRKSQMARGYESYGSKRKSGNALERGA